MTISELICRLQEIKCEHGDLFVAVSDGCGLEQDAREVKPIGGGISYLENMDNYVLIK